MTDHLYKYRKFSTRSLVSLEQNKFYFSNPDYFNDPFDCSIQPVYSKENVEDFVEDFKYAVMHIKEFTEYLATQYIKKRFNENIETLKDEMIQYYEKIILRQVGVFCLSAKNDDLLMWGHYADSHKGFCLEFLKEKDHYFRESKEVDYPENNNYPEYDWPKNPDEMMAMSEQIILTKARNWVYEEEWRIINSPNKMTEHYRGHERSYAQESLSSVIFGISMPKENRELIRKITSNKNIKYKEAIASNNEFKIIIIDC